MLDEATSALDSHTEQKSRRRWRRVAGPYLAGDRPHRLSTIVGADEIIVLDEGRIAGGTHPARHRADCTRVWNRQREAEEARERLARIADENDGAQPQAAAGRLMCR